jgi:hypothetical protein
MSTAPTLIFAPFSRKERPEEVRREMLDEVVCRRVFAGIDPALIRGLDVHRHLEGDDVDEVLLHELVEDERRHDADLVRAVDLAHHEDLLVPVLLDERAKVPGALRARAATDRDRCILHELRDRRARRRSGLGRPARRSRDRCAADGGRRLGLHRWILLRRIGRRNYDARIRLCLF